MDTTYSFNVKRRLQGAAPAAGIAVAFLVLLALFGKPGTWRFWVLLALTALSLWRAARYLWFSRSEVQIDARGLTRSGRTVGYDGAELELKTLKKGDGLALQQVVLWAPRANDGGREGVGFDDSLDRFELAVRALIARVPEQRIRVSTVSEADVQDERREQMLAPLRPTPAERALQELGKSALGKPPHLRN